MTTPFFVQRWMPAERQVEIPAGQKALFVRGEQPDRLLEPGRHPVRGWFQPQPELYLFSTAPSPFFLWLTDLTTADGKPVNLSWQVKVKIVDIVKLWQEWLGYQQEDDISVPAEMISARLADRVQQDLVQRFALEDLRTDRETRRMVGGKLSLLLKEELATLGLEIADQLDFGRMRFATDADLAAAQQERETLVRLQEDESLKTILNRMDNAEMLRYRLREWIAEEEIELSEETVESVVQASLAGQSPAAALTAATAQPAPPMDEATPKPVEFHAPLPPGRSAILRRVSQFVGIGSILAALVLAAIAAFEPELLNGTDNRMRITGIVVGVALAGLLIAWTLDQIMRWEARRTADRLLREANLDPAEVEVGRMELRHLLILLAAMVGLTAAAVAFWIPDLYPWFRLAGGFVGLMGAAMAIRLDWLHNIDAVHRIRQNAQRRVAAAQLTAAGRKRRHRRFQADLAAEIGIIVTRLDEARGRVYRELTNRKLYRQIKEIETKFEQMQPRVQALQNADGDRPAEEWEAIDAHMTTLQAEIQRSSEVAEAVHWHASRADSLRAADRVMELEQSAQEVEKLILRWPAMTI